MNIEFNKEIIEGLMEELKDRRPVFNSEDDFKFSLAWLIKDVVSRILCTPLEQEK